MLSDRSAKDWKMTPKVNYVIAGWFGKRRVPYIEYDEDPYYFLEIQAKQLSTLKHNIDTVTIVIPEDSPNTDWDRIHHIFEGVTAKTIGLASEALGMSYGSFSVAYEKYKEEFTHYIFIEDDYVFVRDHFDQILLGYFEQNPNLGYLASAIFENTDNDSAWHPKHASVFNGMASAAMLRLVFDKYGELPHANSSVYKQAELHGQVGMSQAMIGTGYDFEALTSDFSIPFNNLAGQTVFVLGETKKPLLIVPVQSGLHARRPRSSWTRFLVK
jgi:hypothetical protein